MALQDIVTKGATDRSVTVRIIDSGDGTPETGVVFNTSGIDLWYRREGAAKTTITEATLSALTDAHSDGGFLHIADGEYRLDLPDAAFASGANHVDYGGTVTGMVVIGGRVRLVDFAVEVATQPVNVTQFGGSNGTFAGGRPEVNASHWGGTAVASAVILAAANIANDAITAAKIAADAITSSKIADGALTAAKFASGAFDAVWSVASRLLTAGTNIVLAKGTGVTGFNDLDAAGVRGAVGLSSANLDTQLAALAGFIDTEVAAILNRLGSWTGSARNTVLGAFQALFRKDADATVPSDINANLGSGAGAADNTTDSVEALRDNMGTPQTGDSFARLGAPAGASVSADIAARASQASVDDLPTNAELATALAAADDAVLALVALVKARTDLIPNDPADASDIAALIEALPTGAENATALLDLANGIETSFTLRQALRLILASAAGKTSGGGTATFTIRNVGDSKDRIVATVTEDGDRTAVVVDAA